MANISPSTFYCFPALPPELRRQIWTFALLEQPEATLFPYAEGAWNLCKEGLSDEDSDEQLYDEGFNGQLSDEDFNEQPSAQTCAQIADLLSKITTHSIAQLSTQGSDSGGRKESSAVFKFHTNRLGHTQVEIPLAHVNREARKVVLEWTNSRNNKFKVRLTRNSKQPLRQSFTRPFASAHDVLFVPWYAWEAFLEDPKEFDDEDFDYWQIEDANQAVKMQTPNIERLAVPKEAISQEGDAEKFAYILGSVYFSVRELIIISGDTISPNLVANIPKIEQYWKLFKANPKKDRLSWNIMNALENVETFQGRDLLGDIKILRARMTTSKRFGFR